MNDFVLWGLGVIVGFFGFFLFDLIYLSVLEKNDKRRNSKSNIEKLIDEESRKEIK